MRYDIAGTSFIVNTAAQYETLIMDFFARLSNDEHDTEIFSAFLDVVERALPDSVPFQVHVRPGWQ
jgi:hypothetical protein